MQDRSGAGDGITPEPRRHARIPKQTASSGLISSAVVFFNIDSVMRIMCVILGVTGGNATVHLCDLRNAQSYRSSRFPGNFIKNLFFFFLNPAGHFATQGHSET